MQDLAARPTSTNAPAIHVSTEGFAPISLPRIDAAVQLDTPVGVEFAISSIAVLICKKNKIQNVTFYSQSVAVEIKIKIQREQHLGETRKLHFCLIS